MLDALSWFFAIEALGLLAFPVAFALFRHLPDRGYTLAKPAALVLFSYILWLLGLTQVVPNTQWTIAAILCAGAGIAVLLAWRQATGIRQFLKTNWRTLVAAELVFIGFFGLWLWTVSEAPAINHTEKPMDFGFLNAVLQSRFFPPEDPWLAGSPVSYYYFGHFMMAFITHLTGVASSVGYNLGVAVVPALAAAGAFGLVYNLARMSGATAKTGLVFGAAAPLLVLLAGNLEGALEFVKTQDWAGDGFWAWAGIKGLEGPADAGGGFPDGYWWWFRASRVIDTLVDGQSLDYTITEFPMFSFILGDLHPHVTSLPFVFLGLGLALNLYRSPDALGLRWLRRHPWQVLGLGLFLGALAFINTWDLPTMAALLGAVMLLKAWRDEEGDLGRAALTAGAVFTPVVALSVVFFVPFYLDLDSQASGILPLTGVATRPFLLFLVMGLFLVLTLAFIFRQAFELPRSSPGEPSAASLVVVVALAPILLWLAAASLVSFAADGVGAALDDIGRRAVLAVPGAIIVGAAGFCAFRRARWGPDPAAFVLTLTALGFFLLMGTELYYVVDSFGGAYRRMNTVFKTYYQAWWLLGIAGTYAIYYLWSHPVAVHRASGPTGLRAVANWGPTTATAGRYLGAGILALLLAASFYYSVGAVVERTGVLGPYHTLSDNTLDGLAFVRQSVPGEYAAIAWLRDEAPRGRIVEAVGDDYSEYGRISSSTGLPTVLGWKGHELQWRGSAAAFSGREEAVRRIYTSDDPAEVRRLLETYGVMYVYLGHREIRSYGVSNLAHLAQVLKPVFRQGNVIVYEMIPTPQIDQGSRREGR